MSFSASKAAKGRVVLLYGEEASLRADALQAILDEVQIQKDDFDLESFDADATPATHWMAAAGTAPFLSERRVTIVRHLLRLDSDRVKAEELAALPPTSLLILVADDEPNAEDRASKFTSIINGWKKLVDGSKGYTHDFKADPEQSKKILRAIVEKSGKSIGSQAIELLLEMTGGSLSRATDEIEKVVLYVGDNPQIQESDLRALVLPSREWNIFKLVDAVTVGQVGDALNQLKILVGSAQKAEDAAFRQILPMIARQLRLLWQARVCLDARVSAQSAPPEIAKCFLEKPNLAAEKPYRLSKLADLAKRTPLPNLTRAIQTVCDTDARLKGIEAGFNAMDTLERMVLELCDALAPRPQAR